MVKKTIYPDINQMHVDFYNARKIMNDNLVDLMTENASTEYGRLMGFEHIKTPEAYRKAIPLQDFSAFESYFDRIYQGEENLLYSYNTEYKIMTSGSTNGRKGLVLTDRALDRYSSYILNNSESLFNLPKKGCFFLGHYERPSKDDISFLSAAYYTNLLNEGLITDETFVGGIDTVFMNEAHNLQYMKAWIGLCSDDVHSIFSVFQYDLIMFFQYLETDWRSILSDIEARKVNPAMNLSENQTRILEEKFFLSPERRALLEHEFLAGFDGIALRIWPSLVFANSIGGIGFRAQEALLRKYIGDLPMVYFAYGASECMFGVPVEVNAPYYALLPRSGYYEFLRKSDDTVVDFADVKIDEEYELIISNFCGLYRYRMGDLVRVVDFIGETPIIQLLGREMTISEAGEKMPLSDYREAVHKTLAEYGLADAEFSVGVDKSSYPNHYVAFYEATTAADHALMSTLLDTTLCQINHEYEALRLENHMLEAQMIPVSPNAHRECVLHFFPHAHQKPLTRVNTSQLNFLEGYRIDEKEKPNQ